MGGTEMEDLIRYIVDWADVVKWARKEKSQNVTPKEVILRISREDYPSFWKGGTYDWVDTIYKIKAARRPGR